MRASAHAVHAVADNRPAAAPRGARGSGACGRSRARSGRGRRVATTPAPRSASRSARRRPVTITRRRSSGSRASGSVDRAGARLAAWRSTTARYSFLMRPAAASRCAAACTPGESATIIRPDVSLSSRVRMPGVTRAAVAQMPEQAVERRAGRLFVGGVRDDAGRLVDDQQVVVFVHDRRALPARPPGGRAAPHRAAASTRIAAPSSTVADGRVTTRASNLDRAVFDPPLRHGARQSRHLGDAADEHLVEPPAGVAAVGHEANGLRAHGSGRMGS